jgi:hypothetical protein
VGSLLQKSLPVSTLVVAIDPGKAQNRVWLSTDESGLVVDPLSLPVLRPALEQLDGLVRRHAGDGPAVFAVEVTGAMHRAWVAELNRRFPVDDHDGLLAAVRYRRGLIQERKVAQLHDQLNTLCPGLSAPPGHGRKLDLVGVAGQTVQDCLVDLGGRSASARSLQARASGRLTSAHTRPSRCRATARSRATTRSLDSSGES